MPDPEGASRDLGRSVDPLTRAQALNLKDKQGEGVRSEHDVDKGVVNAFVGRFEHSTFPEPSDNSYRLSRLNATVPYNGNRLNPYYTLTPPEGTDLPTLRVDENRVCVLEGDDVLWYESGQLNSSAQKDLLQRILDAHVYLGSHGVQVPPDLDLSLSLPREGAEEVLTAFSEQFPRSASLIPESMKKDELAKMATERETRERELAEQRALAERQRAEAEQRRKDEEGHDFLDGLQKYADKRTQEREGASEGQLEASLRNSVQRLMWLQGDGGKVVPSAVFADAVLPLIDRFTGGRGYVDRETLDQNPRFALSLIERELSENLFRIIKDPATGKEVIEISPEYRPGRFEREGEMASPDATYGSGVRGHSLSRGLTGELLMKPDDDTTFTDLTVTLAPPDEELDVDLLDRNGNPVLEGGIQKRIKAKPILRARLTEAVAGKEDEKTSLYRTREGLVVICPGGTAKCYPDDLSAQANITRKPVIYLYPKKKTKVHVELDYKGRLTNTYPQINGNSWDVIAKPDGTLQVNGKQYKYLFWDGINGEVEWDWKEGFCVNRNDIDTFLEEKIEKLGLNFAEAQDFITYWAPMMKQNEWSVVSFQTEKYEELAKLFIDPNPDMLIRVFMVFKSCEGQINIPEQKLQSLPRKGFTVVEWGGSNLDELPLEQNIGKMNIISQESHFQVKF